MNQIPIFKNLQRKDLLNICNLNNMVGVQKMKKEDIIKQIEEYQERFKELGRTFVGCQHLRNGVWCGVDLFWRTGRR